MSALESCSGWLPRSRCDLAMAKTSFTISVHRRATASRFIDENISRLFSMSCMMLSAVVGLIFDRMTYRSTMDASSTYVQLYHLFVINNRG